MPAKRLAVIALALLLAGCNGTSFRGSGATVFRSIGEIPQQRYLTAEAIEESTAPGVSEPPPYYIQDKNSIVGSESRFSIPAGGMVTVYDTQRNGVGGYYLPAFDLDPKKLISQLDRDISEDKPTPALFTMRAQLKRKTGDLEGALEDLDSAEKVGEPSPIVHAIKAAVYDDSNAPGKAIIEYGRALNLARGKDMSGNASQPDKDPVGAYVSFFQKKPTHIYAYYAEREIAYKFKQFLLKRNLKNNKNADYQVEETLDFIECRAKEAYSDGDFKKALEWENKGLEQDKNMEAYLDRARTKIKLGDDDGALEDLTEGLDVSSRRHCYIESEQVGRPKCKQQTKHEIMSERAKIFQRKQRLDDAMRDIKEVTKCPYGHHEAFEIERSLKEQMNGLSNS